MGIRPGRCGMKVDVQGGVNLQAFSFRRRRTARSRRSARNRRSARSRKQAHSHRLARNRKLARSSCCSSDVRHGGPSWPGDGSGSAPSGCSDGADDRSSCHSRQARSHRQARSRRWAQQHRQARNRRSARNHRWVRNHRQARSNFHEPGDGYQKDQLRRRCRNTTEERLKDR